MEENLGFQEEKQLASYIASLVRKSLREAIVETTTKRTGFASKATSRFVFKQDRLQRITMKAPHYIFKQHYGFEGSKKNGVNIRLKATNVLNIAIEKGNILNILATGIAEIRAEQVVTIIRI